MRKLIIILLLLLAGAGYYLFLHQEIWMKFFLNPALNKPFAMRTVSRQGAGASYTTEVMLLDGKRWRGEIKGRSEILVAVSDGSTTVSSRGDAVKFHPRMTLVPILLFADKTVAAAKKLKTQVTEECDGHTCWRVTQGFAGATVTFWVDVQTGLPVRLDGILNGKHTENHFSVLDLDFAGRSAEFFDTHSTQPLFAEYLTPTLSLPRPASSASLPAAPQANQVTLTQPIQMPVSIRGKSAGSITLPQGTRVQLISAGKDSLVVGYRGDTATVPTSATDLRLTAQ